MTYKLLFLDVDGTIFKPDHTYTNTTKQAITALQDKGMDVFLATGRGLHELGELAEDLGIQSFIVYNGAFASYRSEIIVNEPFKRDSIERFLSIAQENDHELMLYTRERNYCTNLNRPLVQQFIDTFDLKANAAFSPAITDKVLGVTVLNATQQDARLYEFEHDLHISPVRVNGVESSYDVLRKNVNKGRSVEKILELLKMTPEEAIAFGDGMNDKEMLQTVGESFAMGNADENLFAYAKYRTATVSDDGIAQGLKKLGLL
ncbi:HAD family phosphatase [Lentibacillus cibarius]|uniref:HAD family phosphatase n=1 Tax=Lentibacillus cibarius TaxID=2583219 RepID=A0A549YEQ7_9BACI|nr:HAD family hydrolase [Lentibacillus cibarius]TMN21466.1 HAD family phosphatase [Lentibacillus cibarius]TRM10364.1 HAD family phosphatase [Lentibacillus cibarius]